MLTFTPTDLDARDQIAEWIEKDPDHAGRVDAGFFLPSPNTECFTVNDENGPVFYVRCESALRLHIQFEENTRDRTAKALKEFIPLIEEKAKSKQWSQIIFESVSQKLIRFTECFGYRKSPNEIVKDLWMEI